MLGPWTGKLDHIADVGWGIAALRRGGDPKQGALQAGEKEFTL